MISNTDQNELQCFSAENSKDIPMCVICYMQGQAEDLPSLKYDYENPFDEGPNRLFRTCIHYEMHYCTVGKQCGQQYICRDCLQANKQKCPLQCDAQMLLFDQECAYEAIMMKYTPEKHPKCMKDVLYRQQFYTEYYTEDVGRFPNNYVLKIIAYIEPILPIPEGVTHESMIADITTLFLQLRQDPTESQTQRFKFLELMYLMNKTVRGRPGLIDMNYWDDRLSQLMNFTTYDNYKAFTHPLLKD